MVAARQKQNVALTCLVNLTLRFHPRSSYAVCILWQPSIVSLLTVGGHTPMREMVEKYHTVLVVGGEGEKCREVAEGYGFRDVITPGDIIKDNEATTPFRRLTNEERKNSRKRDYGSTKIEAIFVYVHVSG
jgi:ribonucleotide monophosphatase NagD (HAD superfamily)